MRALAKNELSNCAQEISVGVSFRKKKEKEIDFFARNKPRPGEQRELLHEDFK